MFLCTVSFPALLRALIEFNGILVSMLFRIGGQHDQAFQPPDESIQTLLLGHSLRAAYRGD
jgi:hypothetical protein